MKVNITDKPLSQTATDMLVLFVDKETTFFQRAGKAIDDLAQKYRKAVKKKTLKREMVVHPTSIARIKCFYFYAPSLIAHFPYDEAVKIAVDRVLGYAAQVGYEKVTFALDSAEGVKKVGAVSEGAFLASYSFDKYKSSKDKKQKVREVVLKVDKRQTKQARDDLKAVSAMCESINACRDIVNEPPDEMYPAAIASYARTIARKAGLKCEVLTEHRLKELKYNGILSVGRGSRYSSRMVILRYVPKQKRGSKSSDKKHICLVGKGVAYDTGGYCLKPPSGMWEMKSDMAGAAAVLNAMSAIARLKPPFPVTAIAPLAQNVVSSEAYLPGEIITAGSGKTIHVLNTDAEGRLLLADALYHAGKLEPSHIIDVATLTGSIVRALGNSITGVFTNKQTFGEHIIDAGKARGEDMWLMPLYDEYRTMIKSKVADIDNIASTPNAGATIAALFLSEFVPKNVQWAHLDIAGTGFLTKKWKYYAYGATGCPIKTLVTLCDLMQKK